MSIFNNISVTMDAEWGLATSQLGDGNQAFGRAVGYVAAASTGNTSVRATTYLPQAAAAQRSIKSSSASDAAAGIGAQTITINYLNNNMQLLQDTVTLNGTTAVNTNATDIQFIESMVVVTCGTNLINVGAISMFTGLAGAGSNMTSIAALDGSTFYAHHYVPINTTCYVMKNTGSGTLAVGRSFISAQGDPRITTPLLQIGDIVVHLAGGTEDHDYDVPLTIQGPAYILCKENPVTATANNVAYGSFDWIQD